MNGPMEVNAERGTRQLLAEAGQSLEQALEHRGARAGITCSNTVYYFPIALGILSQPVYRIGDLQTILAQTGEAADKGRAALLAAEVLEALRAADGHFVSPISDVQIHTWGRRIADGRIPGIALLLGRATSPAAASELIEELRRHNILCLLGSALQSQLEADGLPPAGSNHVIALGAHASSAVHGVGLAARCAMKLGGHLPGAADEILDYCRRRMPGFVLALGGLDEEDYAIALGAEQFGFPLIETQGGVEEPRDLVARCLSLRGLQPKTFHIPLLVGYGPAYEDEQVPDADLHLQFGGPACDSFLLLQVSPQDAVTDGRVEVIGPLLPNRPRMESAELGIVVAVSGPKLHSDHEAYLERQIPAYLSYISGIQCSGAANGLTLRVSRAAADCGIDLEQLGRVIAARLHGDYPAVEKAQVTLITDPARLAEWREKARAAQAWRQTRLDGLSDDQVDAFYLCTNCRPIAPRNVTIISPERASPCGQATWLDARAAYELNPEGSRRPVPLGKVIDARRGTWEGTNEYARTASQGRIQQVALYSIMESPMAACADFECVAVLIPEANGVMVLGRADTLLPTPAGLTVETFASLAAGEQVPGIVAMARSHLLSRKFLAAEGGFRRVVWMSSALKDSLEEGLKTVCAREGDAHLMSKIADERQVTTVDELLRWLRDHGHPTLHMSRMF